MYLTVSAARRAPALPAAGAALPQGQPLLQATSDTSDLQRAAVTWAGTGEPSLRGDVLPRNGRPDAAGGATWPAAVAATGAARAALVQQQQGPSCQTLLAPAVPDDTVWPTAVGTARGAGAASGHPWWRPNNAEPPGPGVPDDTSGATAAAEAWAACAASEQPHRVPVGTTADGQPHHPIMPLPGASEWAVGSQW